MCAGRKHAPLRPPFSMVDLCASTTHFLASVSICSNPLRASLALQEGNGVDGGGAAAAHPSASVVLRSIGSVGSMSCRAGHSASPCRACCARHSPLTRKVSGVEAWRRLRATLASLAWASLRRRHKPSLRSTHAYLADSYAPDARTQTLPTASRQRNISLLKKEKV